MEGLSTPDGKPVDLEPVAEGQREFARAMAADNDDSSAPPKRAESAGNREPKAPPPSRRRPGKNARGASKPARPASAPKSDAERRDGVMGYVQIAASVLQIVDSRTAEDNIAWKADAHTLALYAEPLTNAIVETAKQNPGFASSLDRLMSTGPYAALITVGVQLGAQIAANHGLVKLPIAHAPEDIIAASEAQAQQAA